MKPALFRSRAKKAKGKEKIDEKLRNYVYFIYTIDWRRKKCWSWICKAAGAVEVKTEVWGDRKLAYPIKKKENGYYVLTTFQTDGTRFTEIESKLNINESILKYMIVKND